MKISLVPKYKPQTEKEYCCVPAVLQMIQQRRDIPYAIQDEIGYRLGLIVPKDKVHLFTKVRTGKMPKGGWGTQTSKKRYSINSYFTQHNIPLKFKIYRIGEIKDLSVFITQNFKVNNDCIICYNSQILFHSGDREHVSLIQSIDTDKNELLIIDPAKGVSIIRKTTIIQLVKACYSEEAENQYGIWVITGISKMRS